MVQLSDKTILVALGGNALSPGTGSGTITEQFAHTRQSLRVILPFVRRGDRVAITHGNGPQVGDELLRVELAAGKVPTLPLGVAVAATQGTIGYMIEQSLQNALLDEGIDREVVALITQVIVREDDAALQKPAKFIGHGYSRRQAEKLAALHGWDIARQAKGIWRRVVPSPTPLRIKGAASIRRLVESGSIVITAGGGGIPAYVMDNGHLEGVDAVVDKDLAAAVLGENIGASELYIITDVPEVYLHFGTDRQQALRDISVNDAQGYIEEGHFPEGSMGPKMAAALQFLKSGGRKVIITDIDSIDQALAGQAGTVIHNQGTNR